jgi:hypothetical protein
MLASLASTVLRPSCCRALASSTGTSSVQGAFQKMVKGSAKPAADDAKGAKKTFNSKAEAAEAKKASSAAQTTAAPKAPEAAATGAEPLFPDFNAKEPASAVADVLPTMPTMPTAAVPPPTVANVASLPHTLQPHINGFTPRIVVVGCGGAGGNAVNNMIARNLQGVDFLVANTDAQHLATTLTDNRVQLGTDVTGGLGCGAQPEIGASAAAESLDEIMDAIGDANMVFITAGMGGGTGTGAAPVISQAAMDAGMLTVAVVTLPFGFEGRHRFRLAEAGIADLKRSADTTIVVPNQNLFRMADEQTTLVDAFSLADDVLLAGVKSITDLMVLPGLINLDFADVETIMQVRELVRPRTLTRAAAD